MSENVKEELQKLNNRLDRCKYRLDAAAKRDDQSIVKQFKVEIETINKKIAKMKGRQQHTVGNQGSEVLRMPFKRVLTKAEQADMGKFKKSVRGVIVVHPMTALGREIGIKEMTGYAPQAF
ncbi:MAG: YibL family ribosome-associated protein [Aliivibrio sp.]|uniref:YibL family ribosome-associated protein n=1 Tax=Aliivibrio sp. TaxID=1872443 RepID=UPI001A4BC9C4|nr:YibL family ribosome-associated protein [Aliivibrio sp.]